MTTKILIRVTMHASAHIIYVRPSAHSIKTKQHPLGVLVTSSTARFKKCSTLDSSHCSVLQINNNSGAECAPLSTKRKRVSTRSVHYRQRFIRKCRNILARLLIPNFIKICSSVLQLLHCHIVRQISRCGT